MLPKIQSINWVTSESFDESKIFLSEPVATGGPYMRRSVMYTYDGHTEPKDLCVTTVRDPGGLIFCKSVEKEKFGQGDKRVETNHTTAMFTLKGDNPHHVKLYKLLGIVLKRVSELSGISVANIKLPIVDFDDKSLLYTRLIQSNDGKIYSAAYTNDKQIDVRDVSNAMTRPAILFTLTYKDKSQGRLRVQLSQMFVDRIIESFPLANRD